MNSSYQMCERYRCKRQTFGTYAKQRISLGFRVVCMMFMLCLVFIFASAQHSFAYEIATSFGALYGEEGHRHLGADVINITQSSIIAPVAGTVTFCGKVPKADGQRVFALTLKTGDDHLISLSPLKDVSVFRGQTVQKGQVLGALAAFGDPSLDAPHLHVSLRIQKKYVDPHDLIAPALAETAQDEPVLQNSETREPAGVQAKTRTNAHPQVVQPDAHVMKNASSSHVHATHGVESPISQTDCLETSALTMLKERNLANAHPMADVRNTGPVHTSTASGASVERYAARHLSSLSHADIAGFLFLLGLTLTLAGLGGYTLLDRKFDVGRKFAQLAVRGQR